MNRHLRVVFLVLSACLCLAGAVAAQPGNDEAIVRDLYRRYLKREANRAEVGTWVQVLHRGTTPEELRGLFLGSDEFYRNVGNDPQTWFVTVFRDLTGRNPSPDEIRYWLSQVSGFGEAERRQLVRLIMTPPSPPPPPPLPANVARAPDLADRLLVLSRRFVADVRADLGNSVPGQRLVERGDALVGASELFRASFDAAVTAERRDFLFKDVQRAYRALQDELLNPPNTTPTAGPVADRIGYLLRELRRMDFQQQSQSALPVDVPTDKLRRLTAIIAQENRQLLTVLRSINPPNAFSNAVLRYAEQFDGRVGAFRARVPGEEDPRTLQRAFEPVRDQALVIDRLVARNDTLFPAINQHWRNIRAGVQQVAAAVGANEEPIGVPEPSVEPILKTQPGPPLPAPQSATNHAAVTAADEALTSLEAYLTIVESVRPTTNVPAALLTAARELRGELSRFRRTATERALPSQLRSGLEEVNSRYARLRFQVAMVARQNPALDSFQFHHLGEAIERLRGTVP